MVQILNLAHSFQYCIPDHILDLASTTVILDENAILFAESDSMNEEFVRVLDTGVRPVCQSFDDTGFELIPSSWEGECEFGTNFTTLNCNRNLIRARLGGDS
ncbi:Subtilisin-like protease SBT1.7 [Forsythia ovata]